MVATALGARDRQILQDASLIIGVDEVGRGSLAGPVVIGAAAFSVIPDDPGIQDSKKLSPRRREEASRKIRSICVEWVVAEVWIEIIDRINILEATRTAMCASIRSLVKPGAVAVVDYVDPGDVGCEVKSLKKADSEYFSVASASVLAKVHRDRLMVEMGRIYPRWDWEKNKGYGTLSHRLALHEWGRNTFHRRSFRWSAMLR